MSDTPASASPTPVRPGAAPDRTATRSIALKLVIFTVLVIAVGLGLWRLLASVTATERSRGDATDVVREGAAVDAEKAALLAGRGPGRMPIEAAIDRLVREPALLASPAPPAGGGR